MEAIKEFLDEQEDPVLAEDSLEEFRRSGEVAIDIADVDWDSHDRRRIESVSTKATKTGGSAR